MLFSATPPGRSRSIPDTPPPACRSATARCRSWRPLRRPFSSYFNPPVGEQQRRPIGDIDAAQRRRHLAAVGRTAALDRLLQDHHMRIGEDRVVSEPRLLGAFDEAPVDRRPQPCRASSRDRRAGLPGSPAPASLISSGTSQCPPPPTSGIFFAVRPNSANLSSSSLSSPTLSDCTMTKSGFPERSFCTIVVASASGGVKISSATDVRPRFLQHVIADGLHEADRGGGVVRRRTPPWSAACRSPWSPGRQ